MFNILVITPGLPEYQNKQAKLLKKPFFVRISFCYFFCFIDGSYDGLAYSGILEILYTAILTYVLANQMGRIYPNDQTGSFQAGKR